jgi:ABC-type amino acid transport substrate-binding protein
VSGLAAGRNQCHSLVEPWLELVERAPLRFGPFAGVIRTGEEYGIALPIGSPLVSRVDNALASMLSDGTIAQLQRKWLSGALNRLPVLS